ncbi:PREDICTED: leucine-rich repeat-containing protein 37A3-like [Galeopterus variegatus]|uniref:Leucine-rich repeat-containing protein 37A3-like n=1 Tax=Galeopterus variegatus TaxID=482537 RepID=A0ABM0Q234_GALVR|nr:PREDICTED: leucine-rich repeat-containing protein 37A3-like [Galeopterus variegatus]
MCQLRFWALWLLTFAPLWMLVQVAPLPEWAWRPVPLTSNHPELTEPWSSRSSELQSRSPHAFTPPAAPGSFDYLGSSAAFQVLVRSREVAKKLIPLLGRHSAQELPPEPDQFAVLHQDLREKLARPQRLPDEVPVQELQQNQALVLPLGLKSKIQTVDSESSKETKFVVSPLKKDLTLHPRLPKILGIPHPFRSKPKHQRQILENFNGFLSMDMVHPEFPLEIQKDPDERLEAPEPAETNQLQQEALSQNLEPPEEIQFSPPQQDPAQPPQPPEEEEPSSTQKEALEQVETSLTQQEALAQPPRYPEDIEPFSLALTITPEPPMKAEHSTALKKTTAPHPHQDQTQHPKLTQVTVQPLDLELTIATEPTAELKPSPTRQRTPTQPPEPPKEVAAQSPVYQEVTVSKPGQGQAQPPVSPSVAVWPLDLQLTVTSVSTTEAEHSTALKKTTAPHPQQVQTHHLNLTPVTAQPFNLALIVTPEPTMVAEHSTALKKTIAPHPHQDQTQHPKLTQVTVQPLDLELTIATEPTTELKPSPTMQRTPTQPPESSKEVVAQPPVYQEVTVSRPGQYQAQPRMSPGVTVRPLDLELTVTLVSTTEAEHSTAPKKTTAPHPHQDQTQHPKLTQVTVQPLDLKLTITTEPTTELKPSPTMQRTRTQPPELPKEVVAQPPVYQEVTVSKPGQDQAQPRTSPGVAVWPLDLQLTVTSVSTTEAEHHSAIKKTTAPLPQQVQTQNLRCNLISEVSFGTFQAWHGFQFLNEL